MSRWSRDQRGSATVLVVAVTGVLLLVGAALAVVTAMVVSHRSAQSAADLAALAGATDLASGRDGCVSAAAVATANHARLVRCDVTGRDVSVLVEVSGPHWLGQTADLEALSRAGPAP